MANQETLYTVSDRVATITLNRPDKLNAWTAVMDQEVRAAMYEAERIPNVRVIILTGAGRGFCAGADMSLLGAIAQDGLGVIEAPRVFCGTPAMASARTCGRISRRSTRTSRPFKNR